MAKVSVDKLIELVKRSGLVENKKLLNETLAELKVQSGGEYPNDAAQVAEHLVESGLITKWQSDKLLESRHKGFFLGKYKLLGHLGTGGMSSVYLADHVIMRRRVAIKVLPAKKVGNSSYLARFQQEAQAVARLNHKNIVRAYDIDSDKNIHYIVMEFIDGKDLQRTVKDDGPLDYETVANYIAQAAEGLEHAHQAGLIHRDIKPANLLVDEKGVVKILDMGLARFTDEDRASLTVAHDENVLGTADYLAPEQAINSHNVDNRADIYSLGCTAYYLLTGHPPFPEGTLTERLMAHQQKKHASILVDRPDAPKDLVAICEMMMAKSRDQRHANAGLVAIDMARWLNRRGHSFQTASDSGTGSGNLTAAAQAARQIAAESGRGGTTDDRRSPLPPRRKPKKSELHDTIADSTRETQAGGRSASPDTAANPERQQLLKAKPLDEQPTVTDADGGPILIDTVGDAPRPLSLAEQRATKRRPQAVPVGVWIALGAGVVVLLVLIGVVINKIFESGVGP
ncbi:MAG: serine/threonine-protein kinase [Pirellulales bacterium]